MLSNKDSKKFTSMEYRKSTRKTKDPTTINMSGRSRTEKHLINGSYSASYINQSEENKDDSREYNFYPESKENRYDTRGQTTNKLIQGRDTTNEVVSDTISQRKYSTENILDQSNSSKRKSHYTEHLRHRRQKFDKGQVMDYNDKS